MRVACCGQNENYGKKLIYHIVSRYFITELAIHACCINININNGVYFLLGLFFRVLLSSSLIVGKAILTLDSFSSKLHWSTTYRSNNSYCLSVFTKLLNIWAFINTTSLARWISKKISKQSWEILREKKT